MDGVRYIYVWLEGFIKEDKDCKIKLNDYYMCYRESIIVLLLLIDNVILFP